MKLSVVILAKNEAEMIGDCLDSLKALKTDEIIVVDDESTDDTTSTLQYKKVKVVSHKKNNFAESREFGAEKTKGDWILYVDADERLSPDLASEIQTSIDSSTCAGFTLRRVNFYLGKRWPKEERLARLFRKDKLKGWIGEIHETAQVDGAIGDLKAPLYHYTHRNLTEMVDNTIEWSEIEARLRFETGHPSISWWRIPRVMIPTFWDYYVTQGGWKVGTVGLIESIYQAFSIFITYARVWELQQKKR